MRVPTTIGVAITLALGVTYPPARAGPVETSVSPKLRALAARAKDRGSWPHLRRYAESASSAERRALAYFTLGYRQFEAGEYESAAEDLERAAESSFLLADFAAYYQAASARKADQPVEVIAALERFSSRHPGSPLRLEALNLLAATLLEAGRPVLAIEALTAEARVRQRPALAILLARAYSDSGRLAESARSFQEIYYAFPTAPESKTAEGALRSLQERLGKGFPDVPIQIRTARAEILYRRRRFDEAYNEYGALLGAFPRSSYVSRWRLARGRCLIRLQRTTEAIALLKSQLREDPHADAERLATLAEVHRRRRDPPALLNTLAELEMRYPQSPSYASALHEAGNLFVREGDWKAAAQHYRTLAQAFPQSEFAPEAYWRVAWVHYLERDFATANEEFLNHVDHYPESRHLPAAMYWLGRLAEERGARTEARALYESLRKRFRQSFYAEQAMARLRRNSLRDRVEGSSPNPTVAALVAKVRSLPAPALEPCTLLSPGGVLKSFHTLLALGLDDLAERYLKLGLSDGQPSAGLRLALAQMESERANHAAALFAAGDAVPNYADYDFPALPQEVWQLLYPRAYHKLVQRQARAYGLDPHVIMGLIRQESAFNPRATSSANARGLMQVLPRTASPRRRGRRTVARRLYDPTYNVRVGCRYLRGRLKAFDGNLEQALAAYHAGDSRVRRWTEGRTFSEPAEFVESIPIPSTRRYVERVLRDASMYRRLLTGAATFVTCPPGKQTTPRREPAGGA